MKLVKEFKEFINKGNVLGLAVGVIIGGAFGSIVDSLVNNIIMPIISIFTGGMDFSAWKIEIGSGENAAAIEYGSFISAIINFLILAFVVFMIVRAVTKATEKPEKPAAPTTKKCTYCMSEIAIEATRCPNCTSEL